MCCLLLQVRGKEREYTRGGGDRKGEEREDKEEEREDKEEENFFRKIFLVTNNKLY